MDILIRNVDERSLKQIDELAIHSHISRNEYLKNLIDRFCDNNNIFVVEQETNKVLTELQATIISNTEVLQTVLSMFDEDS